MRQCACTLDHNTRRIVLTGGPGAGKTAVLELVRRQFCLHVRVLPEAAGIVFGGGFPRSALQGECRAAQRAIYFVQRELEQLGEDANAAVVLCDRGTVDGAAYWPGPGDFFAGVDTSKEREMRRYDAVIHLRTPRAGAGYGNGNPLRTETAEMAASIDDALMRAWDGHPCRFIVEASGDFLEKAARTMEILRNILPACCRRPSS
jgi:predicted ATPase